MNNHVPTKKLGLVDGLPAPWTKHPCYVFWLAVTINLYSTDLLLTAVTSMLYDNERACMLYHVREPPTSTNIALVSMDGRLAYTLQKE